MAHNAFVMSLHIWPFFFLSFVVSTPLVLFCWNQNSYTTLSDFWSSSFFETMRNLVRVHLGLVADSKVNCKRSTILINLRNFVNFNRVIIKFN